MNAYKRTKDLERRIKVVEWFLRWHNDEMIRIERSDCGCYAGITYEVNRYKKAKHLLCNLHLALFYANQGILWPEQKENNAAHCENIKPMNVIMESPPCVCTSEQR